MNYKSKEEFDYKHNFNRTSHEIHSTTIKHNYFPPDCSLTSILDSYSSLSLLSRASFLENLYDMLSHNDQNNVLLSNPILVAFFLKEQFTNARYPNDLILLGKCIQAVIKNPMYPNSPFLDANFLKIIFDFLNDPSNIHPISKILKGNTYKLKNSLFAPLSLIHDLPPDQSFSLSLVFGRFFDTFMRCNDDLYMRNILLFLESLFSLYPIISSDDFQIFLPLIESFFEFQNILEEVAEFILSICKHSKEGFSTVLTKLQPYLILNNLQPIFPMDSIKSIFRLIIFIISKIQNEESNIQEIIQKTDWLYIIQLINNAKYSENGAFFILLINELLENNTRERILFFGHFFDSILHFAIDNFINGNERFKTEIIKLLCLYIQNSFNESFLSLFYDKFGIYFSDIISIGGKTCDLLIDTFGFILSSSKYSIEAKNNLLILLSDKSIIDAIDEISVDSSTAESFLSSFLTQK